MGDHRFADITTEEAKDLLRSLGCSEDCVNEVNKPDHADYKWHHPYCSNHTSACCGYWDDRVDDNPVNNDWTLLDRRDW